MDLIKKIIADYRTSLVDKYVDTFTDNTNAFGEAIKRVIFRVIPDEAAFRMDVAEIMNADPELCAVSECMHKLVSFETALRELTGMFCALEMHFLTGIDKSLNDPASEDAERLCSEAYRDKFVLAYILGSFPEFIEYFGNIEIARITKNIHSFYSAGHLWNDLPIRYRLDESDLFCEMWNFLRTASNKISLDDYIKDIMLLDEE